MYLPPLPHTELFWQPPYVPFVANPFLYSQWLTLLLFYVLIVLSFLEGYIHGTVQYVTFWAWLLSLSYMYIGFFHNVMWIRSSLFSILISVSSYGCTIACPFIPRLMDIWIRSSFCDYRVIINIFIQTLWENMFLEPWGKYEKITRNRIAGLLNLLLT